MSKELEALANLMTRISCGEDNIAKAEYDYAIIEKSLKALEIIHKNIGLKRLMNEFDYLVNMEEYDLLEEVLL